MNAKKIVENVFLGSSDGLAPIGVKELVFISGKSVYLSGLECFFLIFSKGSWGLDVCHHLIGGLSGALFRSVCPGMWSHLLTPTA